MIEAIMLYFSGTMGMIELLATVASAICVILAARQNIWTWPWGIIGVVLFGYLFYEYKLYSDMGLQLFYFLPLQFVGWYWWLKMGPNAKNDLPVTTISWNKRILTVLGIIISSLFVGYMMSTYTDASFPYADALTTMMSVVAQWYLIRKYWESWLLWVAMDIIAIQIYFYKALFVTSGLYVVFLIIASYGIYSWYKKIDNSSKGDS